MRRTTNSIEVECKVAACQMRDVTAENSTTQTCTLRGPARWSPLRKVPSSPPKRTRTCTTLNFVKLLGVAGRSPVEPPPPPSNENETWFRTFRTFHEETGSILDTEGSDGLRFYMPTDPTYSYTHGCFIFRSGVWFFEITLGATGVRSQ